MATVQMPPLPSPHPAAGPASLLSLSFPSDPQLSPGGERVAFVLTRVGEENPQNPDPEFPKPRYKSRVQLWADGKVRDLTLVEGRDSSPRWAPDGRSLAFLSDRRGEPDKPGKNQVFLLPLDGGEARQLTRFETGVSELAFSPDGRYLSFLSRGDAVDRRDERGEPRATESVRYRFNGRGMLPPESAALYLHDLQSGEASVWHAPASDITDYSWRPDSAGVLFVSSLSEEDAAFWRQEVFELPLGGEPRRLTRWAAPLSGLAPHPDGERFAAVGRPPGSLNTEDPHPFLFTPDGEGRRLDPAWDFPAGNSVAGDLHVGAFPERPVWTDPETLALSYTVGGSCGLFGVSLEGVVSPLLHHPERVVSAFSLIGGGLAYLDESVTEPPEVYLNGRRLTDCAASLPFQPVPARRVTFRAEAGEGEGWVLLPPGLSGEGRVPALLNIHGGPHTAYGHGFMHEFQVFAGQGYGVCYSNPRGSLGYGQAWSEAISGRWGTVDRADLLAFFDRCLEELPGLDPGRTAVMGGSYGGYMTNLITAGTTRFRAAVSDRGICNLLSFGGTSDIGMRFWDDELGGNFHRRGDVEALWAMSPLRDVQDVRTPTLVIHSLDDLRCPTEQAEQWFAALRLHGVEARFVRFPGEDHELSRSGRPDRRLRRLEEYLGWLERHLN